MAELSASQYLDNRSQMTRAELDADDRTHYREPGQEWPDYLDFIDDWREAYREHLSRSRKVVIYHVLAKRNRTINCGDHTHTFSTDHTTGAVYFPNIDTYLDTSACWYSEILRAEDYLSTHNGYNAARLPSIAATYIKRATQMYLSLDGYPSTEPTFNEFVKKYNSHPLRYMNAKNVLANSCLPPLIINDEDAVLSQPPTDPPIPSISKGTEPWVPKNNESVTQDHGLHVLLRSVKMDSKIFHMINEIRKLGHNYTGPILSVDLANAIAACPDCQHFKPKGLSYPGAYYAPPGNGKSHALKTGSIVAVDTDWLIANSNYITTVDPFLRLNIPVITNQHDLFVGAPTKLIGIYDSHHLRKFDCTPYPHMFKKILENLGDDASIFISHQRVSEAALALEISQWVQNEAHRIFSTNMKVFYDDRDTKGVIISHPPNLSNYVYRVSRWDGPTANKRRQYKRRRKQVHSDVASSPGSSK